MTNHKIFCKSPPRAPEYVMKFCTPISNIGCWQQHPQSLSCLQLFVLQRWHSMDFFGGLKLAS